MRNARRNVQYLAFAQCHLFAGNEQLQRTLQHVSHLLAVVSVLRNNRSALQVNLCHGLPLSGDEFSGNHLGDFLESDFVPAEKTIGLQNLFEEWPLAPAAAGRNYSTRARCIL